MGGDREISHRRKRAFTVVFLVIAIAAPACAQRRSAPTQGTAQNPGGSPRQSSGDAGTTGLDKALQNAGIDGDTGRNLKTIMDLVPDNARADCSTLLANSLNKLANAPDRQSAQAALLEVGSAVAGAAMAADWHIHNDSAPKYAHDRAGNIARFVEAITPLLKRTGAGYTDAFIRNAEEKGGGMLWRGTEGFLARSIENSRIAGGAALILTFETGPNPLYYSYTGAPSGAPWVTDKIDLIEANSNPGNAPDRRHLSVFFTSFNFEIRKARNQVPATLSNPFPSPYDLLAQDIADEALKFSGPNLGKLKDVVGAVLCHATVKENAVARNVTQEEVTGNLEQLRSGSPQAAAQAKGTLRAWLQESVEYQLRHPPDAPR